MFKENTLFILGAGASTCYGYPLGKDLIEQIVDGISSDVVYVRLQQYIGSKQGVDQIDKMKFKLSYVIENSVRLNKNELGESNEKFINVPSPAGYYSYAAVPLRNIEELYDLSEALQQFDPVSIDAFLNNHASHALAGKIMIIYTLLKCEDASAFHFKRKRRDHDGSMIIPDNWYSYLIGDLLSGCNQAKEIADNRLSILTFNYDVSLDCALKKKLSGIEMLRGDSTAEEYIKELVGVKIKHIYGKLYDDDPSQVYGNYKIPSKKSQTGNTLRFNKAIASNHLIRLINEERVSGEIENHKELIKNAKKIIIIGFGFDRDNLSMLGFPEKFEEYGQFFEGKQVQYMDYDGSLRSFSEQFKNLNKFFGFGLTRSVSKRIIDAYQNDFKIRLY